jgi:hypothetical protein
MDTWETLKSLSTSIGVTSEAFKKWRRRGVPPRHFFDLLEEARRTGADLSEADLRSVSSSELSQTSRGAG